MYDLAFVACIGGMSSQSISITNQWQSLLMQSRKPIERVRSAAMTSCLQHVSQTLSACVNILAASSFCSNFALILIGVWVYYFLYYGIVACV